MSDDSDDDMSECMSPIALMMVSPVISEVMILFVFVDDEDDDDSLSSLRARMRRGSLLATTSCITSTHIIHDDDDDADMKNDGSDIAIDTADMSTLVTSTSSSDVYVEVLYAVRHKLVIMSKVDIPSDDDDDEDDDNEQSLPA